MLIKDPLHNLMDILASWYIIIILPNNYDILQTFVN